MDPPKDPYNTEEFEEFLKAIGESNIENWSILAQALGVSRHTIMRWKRHPLARQAIKTALAKSIEGMEKSGHDDWRMHREKAKLLGVKDEQTVEHRIDDEQVGDVLDALQSKYDEIGSKAQGQVVEDAPPIQNQE